MQRTLLISGGALALGLGGLMAPTAFVSVAASTPAAQVRTTRFAVANMTCPTCPITVKTAMKRLPGVQSVTVDLDSKTATVVFDPRRTNAAAIAAASTNAGYPAKAAQ